MNNEDMNILLEIKINKIFNELGFRKTLSGRYLWTTLIILMYNDIKSADLRNLATIPMYKLYEKLAEVENTSISRIERNLRTVVSISKSKIQKYFNYNYTINNKTFLILMLEKLKMEETLNAKRYKETNGKGIKTIL